MPKVLVDLGRFKVTCSLASGSIFNIMDEITYRKLVPRPKMKEVNWEISGYNMKDPIEVFGELDSEVKQGGTTQMVKFLVVEGNNGCLLNYQTWLRINTSERPEMDKKREENNTVRIVISDGEEYVDGEEEYDCEIIQEIIVLK